jgi:hypothetical protein
VRKGVSNSEPTAMISAFTARSVNDEGSSQYPVPSIQQCVSVLLETGY